MEDLHNQLKSMLEQSRTEGGETAVGKNWRVVVTDKNKKEMKTEGMTVSQDWIERDKDPGAWNWLKFTRITGGLAFPIGNASFREVVGGELHGDLVSREDADEMHAHFSGDMRDDFMAVLQCDDELCVGEQFFDDALHFYAFFGHVSTSGSFWVINI